MHFMRLKKWPCVSVLPFNIEEVPFYTYFAKGLFLKS